MLAKHANSIGGGTCVPDENHAVRESLCHVGHAALVFERVFVAESLLLRIAEGGCNGVTCDAGDGRVWLGKGRSALDIEALDLHSVAGADELCDNGELLRCIDRLSLAVEVLDAHAVAIEVTAIGITDAGVAVSRVCAAAAVAVAAGLLYCAAGVRRHCRADGIRLPDIHLGAA
jgi:hypothetical protein